MTKTKKTKDVEMTGLTEEQEQEIDRNVAAAIQEILEKNNRALQPYLDRPEYGDIARVRLVRLAKPANTDGESAE